MKLQSHEIARHLTLMLGNQDKKNILRAPQMEAYRDIRDDAEAGQRGGLVERPTGTGKTVLFGMALSALDPLLKKKTKEEGELNGSLILVPTRLLAEQTRDDLIHTCHLPKDQVSIYRPEDFYQPVTKHAGRAGYEQDLWRGADDDWLVDDRFDDDRFYRAHGHHRDDDVEIHDPFNNPLLDEDEMKAEMNHTPDALVSKQQYALNSSRHLIMTYAAFNSLIKRGVLDPARRPVVIADEADMAKGPATLKRLHDFFSDAYMIGFTATDRYVDPKGLVYSASRMLFGREDLIHRTSFAQAVSNGEIVSTHGVEIPLDSHEDQRLTIRGFREFTAEQLRDIVARTGRDAQAIEKVDAHFGERIKQMPQIWFCNGVEHAIQVAIKLNHRYGQGYAVAVSGNTPKNELRDILADYKQGKIKALVNADLLIRGFDAPNAELCVMMSPTRSPTKLTQCVGRVTRLDPDNPNKQAQVVNFIEEGIENTVTFSNIIESERFFERLKQASPDEIQSRAMTGSGASPATHVYELKSADARAQIIYWRKHAGVSSEQAGSVLGISRSLYNRFERTGDMPAKYRGIVADLFKIPDSELTAFLGAFSGYYGVIDPEQYACNQVPVLQKHFGITSKRIGKAIGVSHTVVNKYIQYSSFPVSVHEKLADLFELSGEQRERFLHSLRLPTSCDIALPPMELDQALPYGEMLLQLRRYHGYSMRVLGAAIGIDAALYWQYEHGAAVPMKHHVALANIFRLLPEQRSDFYRAMSNGACDTAEDYAAYGVAEVFDHPILTRTDVSTLGAKIEDDERRQAHADTPRTKVTRAKHVDGRNLSGKGRNEQSEARNDAIKDVTPETVANTKTAKFLGCFMVGTTMKRLKSIAKDSELPFEVWREILFDGRVPSLRQALQISDALEFSNPQRFMAMVREDEKNAQANDQNCSATSVRGVG